MFQDFQGSTKLTLDQKGRLSMPTRYRDVLAAVCNNRIALVPNPEGALLIYPQPRWQQKLAEDVPKAPMKLRRFLAQAESTELDSSGRFLITTELRELLKLDRDVRLLGMGPHFELWDEARFRDQIDAPDNAAALKQDAEAFAW